MPSAVIGALRVDLNLGTAGWRSGLNSAANDANAAAAKFKAVGGTITTIGAGLTAGITAPLLGIGAAAIKTAANFEASMIKVGIATKGTSEQMKAMSDLALQLGKDTVFSAGEAADAMEELAKNGVSVENILDGAATAAVNLAAAAGSELAPAAVAISDTMNQFHLSAKDLPTVIDQITGAVNESKLDFADYQLAMAQAGGVAGGIGVSFKDFNAVLAGTSSLFASGSDAGTSFKTFLTTFNPVSSAAAAAMQQYGLSFYEANGQMKSMGAVAEMLRTRLGGLNDQAKNDVLKTIFGQDAMRTAIGLMNLGAKGLDEIAARIEKTDAAAQSAERMKGLNAQLEQLGGTIETLAIKIGETGILSTVTTIVTGIVNALDKLTELSPAAAQIAVAIAGVAAAIGPIMLVVGPLVSGIGTLITAFSGWSATIGAASVAAGGFLPMLAPFAPVLLGVAAAVGAAYAVWQNWETIGPILQSVWDAFQSTLGPPLMEILRTLWEQLKEIVPPILAFGKAFTDATGPLVTGVLKSFGDVVVGTIKIIGNVLSALIAVLNGDFKGAWEHAKAAAMAAGQMLLSVGQNLLSGLVGTFGKLVTAIRDALVNQLGHIWDMVEKRITTVKNLFYNLYDAVVGHSYIPDMVDGIAAQMARLDAVMVEPTKKATKTAKDAFKQLRDDLAPILSELFPEERALVDLQRKLAVIQRAEKAGVSNGGLTAEQASEARSRLIIGTDADERRRKEIEGMMNPAATEDFEKVKIHIDDLGKRMPKMSQITKQSTAEVVEAFAGMARDVLGSLRGMVSAFKGGDILGGLSGLLDIVTQVTGLIRGTGAPRPSVNVTGLPYGGGRALGGPVVPGKRYRVGERGPEWLEVGQPGRIIPNDNGPSRGNSYTFTGNLMTPEFWAKIEAMDDGAAMRGAAGGAKLAGDQAAYARGRFLG